MSQKKIPGQKSETDCSSSESDSEAGPVKRRDLGEVMPTNRRRRDNTKNNNKRKKPLGPRQTPTTAITATATATPTTPTTRHSTRYTTRTTPTSTTPTTSTTTRTARTTTAATIFKTTAVDIGDGEKRVRKKQIEKAAKRAEMKAKNIRVVVVAPVHKIKRLGKRALRRCGYNIYI